MFRPGRVIASVLLLAAIGSAVQTGWFGSFGLDVRVRSFGSLYPRGWDQHYWPIEPVFRAGCFVLPRLAVCSELALVRTFPDSSSMFLSTPSFSYLPGALYFRPLAPDMQLYLGPATGVTYFRTSTIGWRVKGIVGMEWQTSWMPLHLGAEAGFSYDVLTKNLGNRDTTLTGGVINANLGIRITGVSR